MTSQGLNKAHRTSHEGGGDALAGLKGGSSIGVSGDGHSTPSRHDRRDGADEEGDGGEGSVVERGSMAHSLRVHMPLGCKAILRAQQDEDEDREARLQRQPASEHLRRSVPRPLHQRINIYSLGHAGCSHAPKYL